MQTGPECKPKLRAKKTEWHPSAGELSPISKIHHLQITLTASKFFLTTPP